MTVLPGELLHVLGLRGGEESGAPLLGERAHDGVDGRGEAQAQQPVGLIQDQDLLKEGY